MNRASVCIGCLAALLLLSGCDMFQDAPKSPPPAAKVIASPPTVSPFFIDVVEGKLQRSSAFRIDGDLRPVWIVTGRVRNLSDVEIKSFSLKIDILSKPSSDLVDEAILVVDTDILPGAVGSFSREIQILPPKTPWEWTCDPIKAVPK